MTVKKPICLCLALFMLLLPSACNGQSENPDSKGKDKQDSETYQSHSGTGKTDDIFVQVPTDAEIQSMLENGEIKILWAVEEDTFSQSAAVSVYNTESVDGDTVWNALFSKEDLLSRQQLGGYSKMSITLDGGEYVGQLYDSGLIEFNNLSEFPSALSSAHLMGTLSNFTGMRYLLLLGLSDCVSGQVAVRLAEQSKIFYLPRSGYRDWCRFVLQRSCVSVLPLICIALLLSLWQSPDPAQNVVIAAAILALNMITLAGLQTLLILLFGGIAGFVPLILMQLLSLFVSCSLPGAWKLLLPGNWGMAIRSTWRNSTSFRSSDRPISTATAENIAAREIYSMRTRKKSGAHALLATSADFGAGPMTAGKWGTKRRMYFVGWLILKRTATGCSLWDFLICFAIMTLRNLW